MAPAPADRLECDLLVVGAGMAGLTAAATAARNGARVVVVEKAATIGGSARLSSGYLWTLQHVDDFDRIDPGGDRALQTVIVEEFPAVVEAVQFTGVEMSDRIPVLDGAGYQMDIVGYLERCRATVQGAGGDIVCRADVEHLLTDAGGVAGARVADATMVVDVVAPWTLVATGGFANSQEMLAKHTLPPGLTLRARAGSCCRGDGLRLVEAAGGAAAPANSGFYGHLVAWQVTLDDPERWDTLTLLHSRAALLVNEGGERFTDETRGDNISALATAAAGGRGLLLWDEDVQREFVLLSWPPGNAGVDKFEIARRQGGIGRQCADIAEVCSFADAQGFSGPKLSETIADLNASIARDADAGRATGGSAQGEHRPIVCAPFYALVVEPAVTFPFAGIRVDSDARVLDASERPVDGLLAAGVDVGNVYREGYAGGLSLAAAFAIRAIRTAGLA